MKRREFLKKAASLGAAVAMSRLPNNVPRGQARASDHQGKGNAPVLARRAYGQTGVKLSIIGLGGIVISGVEQKHANEVVSRAIEKGVNYFDVAPIYGDAELKLGPALKPYRKNVFLACKTTQRKSEGVRAELKATIWQLRWPSLSRVLLSSNLKDQTIPIHPMTRLSKDSCKSNSSWLGRHD